MKFSCLLIIGPNQTYLGVSRGLGVDNWALPGGKAEPGETAEETAYRELQEETGLEAQELRFLTTIGEGSVYYVPRYQGHLQASHEGDVAWVTEEQLLTGEFSSENKVLFDFLRKHKMI